MAKYDLWPWPISIKYWLNDKWYELGRYEDLHSTWTGLKCIHTYWGLVTCIHVVAKSGWVVLRPQPEFLVHFLDLGGTKRLYCRWEKLSFTINAKKSDLYSFVIWSKFQGYLGSSCFLKKIFQQTWWPSSQGFVHFVVRFQVLGYIKMPIYWAW